MARNAELTLGKSQVVPVVRMHIMTGYRTGDLSFGIEGQVALIHRWHLANAMTELHAMALTTHFVEVLPELPLGRREGEPTGKIVF